MCWHDPVQFSNVIAHPGGMHIMQSFISSIAKLMKSSGLETYMASAYRGLIGMLFIDRVRQNLNVFYVVGILNGKSWVKAMRAFRGVSEHS